MSELIPFPEFEEKVQKVVRTPDVRPEFVGQLRKDLLKRQVKTRPRFALKPAWGLLILLLAVATMASAPRVVKALMPIFSFSFVPDVERALAEPVSMTRDGVTLTIEHVFVYEDHVELFYNVQGIDLSNDGAQAEDGSSNSTAFCSGETDNDDGGALLRLPDGTVLERDCTGLYKQDTFARQLVFEGALPEDVMEMTLVFTCIPGTRPGAVPENWELPFELAWVPEGGNVDMVVIEAEQGVPEFTIMEQAPSGGPEIIELTGGELQPVPVPVEDEN